MFEPVVYVIDDDISVREALGNLLRSVGLKMQLFPSVPEFRRYRPPPGPCCLVLDVRLPSVSGLELQAELSAAGDKIPIIFITGHGDVPMSVRAMKAGAIEFLQKPFREQDLLDAIHLALNQSATITFADAGTTTELAVTAEIEALPSAGSEPIAATALNPRQALSRNLQMGRTIFCWSQEELGERCGLHRSHISALEREALSVGVDAIDQIALTFGVSSHVLLMPPANAQSALLNAFNDISRKSPGTSRSRRR